MRKYFGIVLMAATTVLGVVSCADPVVTTDAAYEKLAFEAWMSQHGPADAVLQPNGMYVQFLEDGDAGDEGGATADADVWVRINFTSTNLAGDVFTTRSEAEALKQGIYTPKTYYTPDFVFCGSQNVSLLQGRYYAMKNELYKTADGSVKTKLYKGSKVRLFMPSTLAYGSTGYSDDQGYGGQFPLDGNRPIIETLEIVEVVEDPIPLEEQLVKYKATAPVSEGGWGLTDANLLPKEEQDINEEDASDDKLFFEHFYIDSMYRAADAVPLDVKTQLLTDQTTARIWYVSKFVNKNGEEEFIRKTNIQEVADKFYYRQPGYEPDEDSEMGTALVYCPDTDQDSQIPAFYDMIPKMRRGRWYRVVFTSSYGYGATGYSATIKSNQDYYDYYMETMMSMSGYGSGYGYGSSYYDSYYSSYYSNYGYMNYDTTSGSVTTEVLPYTPLIYEIYIETDDVSGVKYY
jgi:hypothetical protein